MEFLIPENVLFFISRMWFTYIKNLIFWYQIIFLISQIRILEINDFFISQKMSGFFYIRQIFYWYQEFESLKTENALIFISRMWISDIKNQIFWHQKSFFDITSSSSWNQTMIFDISNSFFWYHKFEFEFFIFYIKNVDFWYQILDTSHSHSGYKRHFLISKILIPDINKKSVWSQKYKTFFDIKKIIVWFHEFNDYLISKIWFLISEIHILDIKFKTFSFFKDSNSWYQ